MVNFDRVEKSLWNSSTLKPEVIKEHLVLGLEQAKDTQMPKVTIHPVFRDFVQQLASITKDKTAIVAHPGGQEIECIAHSNPIALVIGPEGGIMPHELDRLTQAGFSQASFGDRILRVDAAITYITAKLF